MHCITLVAVEFRCLVNKGCENRYTIRISSVSLSAIKNSNVFITDLGWSQEQVESKYFWDGSIPQVSQPRVVYAYRSETTVGRDDRNQEVYWVMEVNDLMDKGGSFAVKRCG